MAEEEQVHNKHGYSDEMVTVLASAEKDKISKKMRMREKYLLQEATRIDKCGVCYLSHVPTCMDPFKLQQILSSYGEIERIYLAPEDMMSQIQRKRAGGFRGAKFSEGWVEFTRKSVAKRVAKMLNGEQIGGKRRSPFYYDLWNIKYLSKFKWDHLTEEIAYKKAMREQRQVLELSAAKRERDFYLSKVDKSRALKAIQERKSKKQWLNQVTADSSVNHAAGIAKPNFFRKFKQSAPIEDGVCERKHELSREILAGVFGPSSCE